MVYIIQKNGIVVGCYMRVSQGADLNILMLDFIKY